MKKFLALLWAITLCISPVYASGSPSIGTGDNSAAAVALDLNCTGCVEYDEIAETTSANWATRVSDETGTGLWVFSTNPVFTTAITVPNTINTTAGDTTVGLTNADEQFVIKSSTGTLPTLGASTVGVIQRNTSSVYSARLAIIAGTAGTSGLNFGDVDDEDAASLSYDHVGGGWSFRSQANNQRLYLNNGNPNYIGVLTQDTADADGTPLYVYAGDAGTGGTGNHNGANLYLEAGEGTGTGTDGNIVLNHTLQLEGGGTLSNLTAYDFVLQAGSLNTHFMLQGHEASGAYLYLISDEGDDNDDRWRFAKNDSSTDLTLASKATGSWVTRFTYGNTGDLVMGSNLSLGTAGVKLTGDGDGALTMLGMGDGADEALTWDFDETPNTIEISSPTGVNSLRLDRQAWTFGIRPSIAGVSGYDLTITASGGGAGDTNGGNLYLQAGQKQGTGTTRGKVQLGYYADVDLLVVNNDDTSVEVNGDLDVATGENITLGSTQWNSGDSIDGQQLAAGSVDAVALDLTDITLADFTNDAGFLTSESDPVFSAETTFAALDTRIADATLVHTASTPTWTDNHIWNFGGTADKYVRIARDSSLTLPTLTSGTALVVDNLAGYLYLTFLGDKSAGAVGFQFGDDDIPNAGGFTYDNGTDSWTFRTANTGNQVLLTPGGNHIYGVRSSLARDEDGGDMTIQAGVAGSGGTGNHNGGDLYLTAGDKTGSGTDGKVIANRFQGTDIYSGDGSQGITDTTSYWICTAADCSTKCQVSVKDGLITACA